MLQTEVRPMSARRRATWGAFGKRAVMMLMLGICGLIPQTASAQARLPGIDVSNYQGDVDWTAVADAGQRFSVVLATDGTSFVNPLFDSQYDGAKAAGLYVGTYHFARPHLSSGRAQADFFLDHARFSDDGWTLPPALDLEYNPVEGGPVCYGLTPAQMVAWVQEFVARVRERTGRDALIYTGYYPWLDCTNNDPSFGANPLWVVDVNNASPKLPASWNVWTFWQYGQGQVPGIPANVTDLNYVNGDEDVLKRLAEGPVEHDPFGALDVAEERDGKLFVSGWTIDADAAWIPTDVHVYVDDVGFALGPTDVDRPDVQAVYPRYGLQRGFARVIDYSAPGTHRVCAYGINYPDTPGQNALLGCREVELNGSPAEGHDPFGSLDAAEWRNDGLFVSGWTIDADAAWVPTDVHVYVDDQGFALGPTDVDRPDVEASYPGYGLQRGFAENVPFRMGGKHQVCAYGINYPDTPGTNTSLGCRSVDIPNPFGHLDAAEPVEAGIHVRGWTIESDHVWSHTQVDIYVDGQPVTRITADVARPDVQEAYPNYGLEHGFDAVVPNTEPGEHTVCAYGINTPDTPGVNVLLDGCRTFTR